MLKSVEDEHLMDGFVNGLREEISSEVMLYEPKSLSMMVKKSILIEKKNKASLKSGAGTRTRGVSYFRSLFYQDYYF